MVLVSLVLVNLVYCSLNKILYYWIDIIYSIYCLFLEDSKGSGNITHTNKKDKDTALTLKFKHPEILHQFNKNIENQYNTVRGFRIDVIEDLLTSYNTHLKVITEDPEEVKAENMQLKKNNKQLLKDNQEYEETINTITHENNELKQQVKELIKQIENKNTLLENNNIELKEKAVLEEKVKNNTLTIDDLKKNLKEVKQKLDYKEKKLEENDAKVDKVTAYSFKLKDDISNLKDVINSKDNYIKDLKGLGTLQRLLKRYPEEEVTEDLKELPLVNE